jgi:hypothetical protein
MTTEPEPDETVVTDAVREVARGSAHVDESTRRRGIRTRRGPIEVRLHVPGDVVWSISTAGVVYAWRIASDGHPVMTTTDEALDQTRRENASPL